MNMNRMINPYLQMSRLVGSEIDFNMVQHFAFKYIDDAVKNGGKSYSDASNDLKMFFVQLSDAIFQATVNYEENNSILQIRGSFEEAEEVEDSSDDLLSVKEISEILKVTRQQVRNWINTGKLKSIKLSERGTRVKRADFDDFLKIRKV